MSQDEVIITKHDPKPIPSRAYDWEAIRQNYDEGDCIGYGITKQEAIIDLVEKEHYRYERKHP